MGSKKRIWPTSLPWCLCQSVRDAATHEAVDKDDDSAGSDVTMKMEATLQDNEQDVPVSR